MNDEKMRPSESSDPPPPPTARPRHEPDAEDQPLDAVDEAGIESFPASDPPASNGGGIT